MNQPPTLEELHARIDAQDRELEEITRLAEEMPATARFEIPSAFFEDLDAACAVRQGAPASFIYGLRA